MVESILRRCGYRTGLFTSPHLWTVRERIQINGYVVAQNPLCWLVLWYLRSRGRCCCECSQVLLQEMSSPVTIVSIGPCRRPVEEDVYLRAFWHCYRILENQADEMVGKAAFFRFLTLLGRKSALVRMLCSHLVCKQRFRHESANRAGHDSARQPEYRMEICSLSWPSQALCRRC